MGGKDSNSPTLPWVSWACRSWLPGEGLPKEEGRAQVQTQSSCPRVASSNASSSFVAIAGLPLQPPSALTHMEV